MRPRKKDKRDTTTMPKSQTNSHMQCTHQAVCSPPCLSCYMFEGAAMALPDHVLNHLFLLLLLVYHVCVFSNQQYLLQLCRVQPCSPLLLCNVRHKGKKNPSRRKQSSSGDVGGSRRGKTFSKVKKNRSTFSCNEQYINIVKIERTKTSTFQHIREIQDLLQPGHQVTTTTTIATTATPAPLTQKHEST